LRDCPGRQDKLLWSINLARKSANLICGTARFSSFSWRSRPARSGGVPANMLFVDSQPAHPLGPFASLAGEYPTVRASPSRVM
jgi:hypothetical protein